MKNLVTSNNYLPFYTIIALLISYIVFLLHFRTNIGSVPCSNTPPIHIEQSVRSGISNIDRFNDPYDPPLRNDTLSFFPGFGGYRGRGYGIGRSELDLRGAIPVPIPMNGYPLDYTQIGILTKNDEDEKHHPLILPLMGRKSTSRRDKHQYHSISNTGSVNTKLPIKVKGKSCTSENGCDEIYSGDEVYVNGYNTKFVATIYENNSFEYVI